jgi:hypothetical protein
MNRRELLAQIALTAAGTLTGAIAEASLRGASMHAPPTRSALRSSEREMVSELAELIIPRTDTPGALDAAVPAFIDQIVSNWYSPGERTIFREGLAALDAFCRRSWSRPFIACDPGQKRYRRSRGDAGICRPILLRAPAERPVHTSLSKPARPRSASGFPSRLLLPERQR